LAKFPQTLQSEFVDGQLLSGASPARLALLQKDVTQAGRLLDTITRHGLIVAAEVGPMPNIFTMAIDSLKKAAGKADISNPLMPPITVTLIVPDAAKDAATIQGFIRLQLMRGNTEPKEELISGRRVIHARAGEVNLATWVASDHVVVSISTEPVANVVARAHSQAPRIATNPLYERMVGFREFPTDVRGYADLRSLLRVARQGFQLANLFTGGQVPKFEALGLDSFESFVWYCGFEGPTRREVAELHLANERTGLARLLGGAPLRWEQLPPLPADVGKWSAHRMDFANAFGQFTDYVDRLTPNEEDKEPAAVVLDKAAGLSVKEELIDQLGDLLVTWSSPTEGAVMFGQVMAVRVKDAPRVEAALDQIIQNYTSANLKLKKRPCLDAVIRELQFLNSPGVVVLPSYVVYKDWLVFALYPQPLQAFVQRAAGNLPVWQADSETQTKFADLPRTCSSWAFNDSRPGAQQALTFAPLILEATQSFNESTGFDVGTLPSASAVMPKLKPSITGIHDDGRRIRWDSRGGLLVPGDSIGLDPVMIVFATQIFN
jgi:hypothetical protein